MRPGNITGTSGNLPCGARNPHAPTPWRVNLSNLHCGHLVPALLTAVFFDIP